MISHTVSLPASSDNGAHRPHEGIAENLKFLILEVDKQLARTADYLSNPTKALARKVALADDYIDNLKTIIQRKSFATAAEAKHKPTASVELMRTYEIVASNLERIADFCEKILEQMTHIDQPSLLQKFNFSPYFSELSSAMGKIESAMQRRDVRTAFAICKSEKILDQLYAREFAQVLKMLRADHDGTQAQSLVTVLFIAHYLERMGDSLLNVGEAIVSAHLGERIKIGQLKTLENSLHKSHLDAQFRNLSMRGMGETKSGARVASVSNTVADGTNFPKQSVIFKEGKTQKLQEERDSIARWEQLMPGLAPKIYSFHAEESEAAILFEYLPGKTFESVLFECSPRHLNNAIGAIEDKLKELWTKTRTSAPAHARFMAQLEKRLGDVFAVHPEFDNAVAKVGSLEVEAFSSLVERLKELDTALAAPFSVFIHGDFNLDNVIYDDRKHSVRFIDLHRSTMMDYVQDISVFLVSHFRLQVASGTTRRRIRNIILRFFQFAGAYAQSVDDHSYPHRLALGVARSLATSTRFLLDPRLGRDMFLRSRYLLERVAEAPNSTPDRILTYTQEVLLEP